MLEINRKKRYADQGNAKAKKISEQRASSSKECFTKATLTSNSSQPDKSTTLTNLSTLINLSDKRFRINNPDNSLRFPGESASLSIIKEFLNSIKSNLFSHYIDLINERLSTTALESAAKSYATISKQISIVSIRKEKWTTMSNDLSLRFFLIFSSYHGDIILN